MRILFVSSGLDPRTGGTATAAVSVCLAARRAGLEVDLLYPVERGVEPLIGSTVALLAGAGVTVRAFPFANEVIDFVNEHDHVFVVEQNESGQLRMLLVNEGDIDPKRLLRVLHYDGTPITAGFIHDRILELTAHKIAQPQKQVA